MPENARTRLGGPIPAGRGAERSVMAAVVETLMAVEAVVKTPVMAAVVRAEAEVVASETVVVKAVVMAVRPVERAVLRMVSASTSAVPTPSCEEFSPFGTRRGNGGNGG